MDQKHHKYIQKFWRCCAPPVMIWGASFRGLPTLTPLRLWKDPLLFHSNAKSVSQLIAAAKSWIDLNNLLIGIWSYSQCQYPLLLTWFMVIRKKQSKCRVTRFKSSNQWSNVNIWHPLRIFLAPPQKIRYLKKDEKKRSTLYFCALL